ncbi:hypothetical protein L3X38_032630 [Prunus dulcis]|uniref:Uncharacterized protein n=1 Tax=Prunus dulcis TaxID=3755 RepID=A0AAD4YWT6_PRUDU|nr:hypothetical protein L3X38_032630 [Prunus dulcis]
MPVIQADTWPFMQWAIDLVGPMPQAPAKKDMMIVTTDYFTKWIEAEALSSTKKADVERFIWKKRLKSAERKWVDELPRVLWAYHTNKIKSTGKTSFSLAYGTEAIISPHYIVPSMSIEDGNLD